MAKNHYKKVNIINQSSRVKNPTSYPGGLIIVTAMVMCNSRIH